MYKNRNVGKAHLLIVIAHRGFHVLDGLKVRSRPRAYVSVKCVKCVKYMYFARLQDTRLREIVEHHGARNWRMVAEQLGTPRSDVQCLHR